MPVIHHQDIIKHQDRCRECRTEIRKGRTPQTSSIANQIIKKKNQQNICPLFFFGIIYVTPSGLPQITWFLGFGGALRAPPILPPVDGGGEWSAANVCPRRRADLVATNQRAPLPRSPSAGKREPEWPSPEVGPGRARSGPPPAARNKMPDLGAAGCQHCEYWRGDGVYARYASKGAFRV